MRYDEISYDEMPIIEKQNHLIGQGNAWHGKIRHGKARQRKIHNETHRMKSAQNQRKDLAVTIMI